MLTSSVHDQTSVGIMPTKFCRSTTEVIIIDDDHDEMKMDTSECPLPPRGISTNTTTYIDLFRDVIPPASLKLQQQMGDVVVGPPPSASPPPHPPPPPLSSRCPLKHGCLDPWTWNRQEKSHEVRLHGPKGHSVHFHPNWSNGTAGVRGSRVLNGGVYYWEIKVSQRVFGTSMMFGVGTNNARLHVDAFVNLLGEDDQSWGLSHKGLLWHDGQWRQYSKPFRENEATVIGLLFDGKQGTLTYYKDNVCLGIAFTGLNKIKEELYPIICSTAAKTEMTLGLSMRGFVDLQDRCRAAIVSQLNEENAVDSLPMPNRIKQFIKEGCH